jgi:hypothetical protein
VTQQLTRVYNKKGMLHALIPPDKITDQIDKARNITNLQKLNNVLNATLVVGMKQREDQTSNAIIIAGDAIAYRMSKLVSPLDGFTLIG